MPADLVRRLHRSQRLVHQRQRPRRFLEAPELRPLVVQPGEAVEVAHRIRRAAPCRPLHRGVPRRAIARGRLVPVPQLHERMRGHVQRVARRRRNGRIGPSRRQRFGRQRAVIVGVEDVVRRARMLRVAREHTLDDGAGLLAEWQGLIPARQDGEQAERIEALRLIVRRELRDDRGQRFGMLQVASALVAGAVQGLDGGHVALLARRLGFREPLGRRRAQLAQHGPPRFQRPRETRAAD